jgi:hypothetical protein
MPKILHLTLRRKFFAAIAAGDKRTEYREQKPYWRKRLEGREYDVIKFRNGYAVNAPEMLVEFRGLRRYGKGREARYAIRLGRVLWTKQWTNRKTSRSKIARQDTAHSLQTFAKDDAPAEFNARAAMVKALTPLACASPANCLFQASKPAAVLPHCAALALPVIDMSATKTPTVTSLNCNCLPSFIRTPLPARPKITPARSS